MDKWFKCKKCGEMIEYNKEKAHKIFCYTWVNEKCSQ